MSKRSIVAVDSDSANNSQMALFDLSSLDTPLPERVAIKYGFPLAKNGDLYAVQDWIAGVSQSKHYKSVLSHLKKNNPELLNSFQLLPYTAADGKVYDVQHADAYTLYGVTIAMRSKSGIRDAVLEIMKQSTEFLDWANRHPELAAEGFRRLAEKKAAQQIENHQRNVTGYLLKGYSENHAEKRVDTKESGRRLTGALQRTHKTHKPNYGAVLGLETQELFHMTPDEIIEYLGRAPKDRKNYRDFLSPLALDAIRTIDDISVHQLEIKGRPLTNQEQQDIVRDVVEKIGRNRREEAKLAGRDFISGADLDPSGAPRIARNRRLLGRGKQ